jgi:hypothetical protein
VRVLLALASCGLLGGCSFLDQLAIDGEPQLDPNKIYLGTATVRNLQWRELDQYACVNAPLLCTQGGTSYECRCPR